MDSNAGTPPLPYTPPSEEARRQRSARGQNGTPPPRAAQLDPGDVRSAAPSGPSVFVHSSGKVTPEAVTKLFDDVLGAGRVASIAFREKQNFGFVQLTHHEDIDRAVEMISGLSVGPAHITVQRSRVPAAKLARGKPAGSGTPPAAATPPPAATPPSAATPPPAGLEPAQQPPSAAADGSLAAPVHASSSPVPTASAQPVEPSNSLVIKNLPFQMRPEDLTELLAGMDSKPQHVKFHLDAGIFRGIAFVKFRSVDVAAAVLPRLHGLDINGRKLRAEFKRPLLKANEADLDDEEAGPLREQLRVFKEDGSAQELAFPSTLPPLHRKFLHIMADKLDLAHYSVGEGETRHLVVSKRREKPDRPAPVPRPTEEEVERNWRQRVQEERQQRAARVEPLRAPRLPEPGGKGFSEEYRASRRAAAVPPAALAQAAAAAVAGGPVGAQVTSRLNPTAPAFVPVFPAPVLRPPSAAAAPAAAYAYPAGYLPPMAFHPGQYPTGYPSPPLFYSPSPPYGYQPHPPQQ